MAGLLIIRAAVSVSHSRAWVSQACGGLTITRAVARFIYESGREAHVATPKTPLLRFIGLVLLLVVALILGRYREARGRAVAPANIFKLFQGHPDDSRVFAKAAL